MIPFKEYLEEGALNKENKVHHDEASKKFAKDYIAGHKGDYRYGGPTDADTKNSEKFWSSYDHEQVRSGFAGSGTHVFTHKKTGEKFEVDKTPSGKGFYGTDHHIRKLS